MVENNWAVNREKKVSREQRGFGIIEDFPFEKKIVSVDSAELINGQQNKIMLLV
jgi:hypothetical protein